MKEKEKKSISSVSRFVLSTVFIILFFVGIITAYYIMLYSETRENVIMDGELNAIDSAIQIDKYLSTGVDTIKLSSYTIDKMLTDRRSQEEILDYIKNQSVAISYFIPGNTTGIYGFINGEYLDGDGWVPDDDYVPTERPWYTGASAGKGKIVVVDPYLDAQTGTMMITLAKLLYDSKSVVAMDISMARLQAITESNTADASIIKIILDREYNVIAHSSVSEAGKNYLSEKDTLGSAIAEKLQTVIKDGRNKGYFSLRFGKAEYMIYAKTVENDWLCVSVTDATSVFGRLRTPLVVTVLLSGIVVGFLLIIMIRTNRSSVLAEQMKELADRQTVYAHSDEMTGLKNRRAYAEMVQSISGDISDNCCVMTVDVNGLKRINDTLGHEAGDELIRGAAGCMKRCFGRFGDIYRTGGDEFVAILDISQEDLAAAKEMFDDVLSAWHGEIISEIHVSCGYARYSDIPGADINELIKLSDERMYDEKSKFYRKASNDRRDPDGRGRIKGAQ